MTAICAAMLGFAVVANAADPITVSVSVTGTPSPGATVSVKANVATTDGSTVSGISWKQTAGITVPIANGNTDTITIILPDRKTFREELMTVFEEPPIFPGVVLPKYVPPPTELWESGLQDNFDVTAVIPHAASDTAAMKFELTITTSKGTYKSTQTVNAVLPYMDGPGLRNVPINVPVILHGKKAQTSFDWKLTAPTGSKTALLDPTSRFPEFTPDIPGTYKVSVTDKGTGKTVAFDVYAGTWKGVVVGQDANGRPTTDNGCKSCHVLGADMFTPWAKTGHAEIFTQNVVDNGPTAHYSESCLGCHTVGYSATPLNNGGITDQADWKTLQASHMIGHGDPLNWTNILTNHPASARMTNIQCENCHGPQASDGHTKTAARVSLSSDVCGSCHGEPARHGRYQQWQLSGHGNYETAKGEGTNPSCAACHSAQGFMQWQDKGFSSTATMNVTWTTDDVHPQTCVVCHDPHGIGTTSGGPTTNATVRIMGDTPVTMGGYAAKNMGTAAVCITCHNGRRGLRDDQHFSTVASDLARAPHEGPQGDILMGQNLYFTKVGTPSNHASIESACVTCHMEKSDPPAGLANYSASTKTYGGTNHTFNADPNMCSKCHTAITTASVQSVVETKMASLKAQIEKAILANMQAQIRAGNAIAFSTVKTVKYANDLKAVEFISSHGAQGITTTLADGTKIADLAFGSISVVRPGGSSVPFYTTVDPNLPKAGWNYMMVSADKSKGVHNPAFVNSALDVSVFAATVAANNATAAGSIAGGTPSQYLGGGIGNGAGAVTCKTSYVYWNEVAGHMPGANGSQWRTDVIARNLGSKAANLTFYLHQGDGSTIGGNGTVPANGQKAFEDLVASWGTGNNMGSLEICSDQPLLVNGRIFNETPAGTFGQNLDGKVADIGYSTGQTVNLIGLRQTANGYRSNISVTNAGTTEAQVAVTLYDSTGLVIKNYTLTVPAGLSVTDTEPYRVRANTPDIGWGFATVTVVKGSNVHASASLIDGKTNDPTTITAKQ